MREINDFTIYITAKELHTSNLIKYNWMELQVILELRLLSLRLLNGQ